MPLPDVITGTDFMIWLGEHGIIPPATRRVIIDAQMGQALTVYVEQLGTREMIQFDPPSISPAQVYTLERDDG